MDDEEIGLMIGDDDEDIDEAISKRADAMMQMNKNERPITYLDVLKLSRHSLRRI